MEIHLLSLTPFLSPVWVSGDPKVKAGRPSEKTPHVETFGRLLRLFHSEFIYEDARKKNVKIKETELPCFFR